MLFERQELDGDVGSIECG